jgi:hypothetical protein
MKTIPNSYPILREAKVINTTDSEKLGRIQLKVYPELAEIPDADCPWCFPFSGGIHGKSFGVPLVGQLVTCVVWNRYWNEITFLPFNITKPTEHLFDKFMSETRPLMKDVPTDPEEEHLAVERYEDDFAKFDDTKNRQHGWVHPSGAHGTINNEGDIWLWLIKMFTLHNGDDSIILEIDPEKQQVDFYQKGKLNSETDDDVNIVIHKNLSAEIDKNVTILIHENSTSEIDGDVSNTIHKTLTELVDKAVKRTLNDTLTEVVAKAVDRTLNDVLTETVAKAVKQTYGATWDVTTAAATNLTAGGPMTLTAPVINLN